MSEQHDEPDLADLERRMEGAITALKHEFGGLRTGRASASLLEPVMVDAYGTQMPMNQVGTVSVPEPRMLSVNVWDKTMVAAVEKAIRNAGLGVNPIVDGQTVRVPIPELNEERRVELTRVAAKYAEQAKVAVRNVRRDGMESIKRSQKEGRMSEDEMKVWHDEIQTMTDATIKQVDDALAHKEGEIMQV
ncbi:MAG: ribosome recycling factor [Alphaproteobacteria bacterium]|nr:MAG: ribosome recycling factor [Alphaproteobacteria bacterium]